MLNFFLNTLKGLKKSKTKPQFIDPSKEDCLNLIKSNYLKWNKLKAENPGWFPNLDDIDFESINLSGVDLRNCSLKNTDLSRTINLHQKSIGGSNLDEAKLPEKFEFTGLNTVKELSIGSSTIFITIIFLCFYCFLTILATNDLYLLTNSSKSTLPIINVSIDIIGFYWAAPLMLLACYIYFHLNLRKLWYEFSQLPTYFPDGKSIDQKSYSWLVNDLVIKYMPLLQTKKAAFLNLQNKMVVVLTWGVVPATIFTIWLKYLVNHDLVLSFIHSVVLSICIAIGIMFFQNATRILRCNSDENKKMCNFICFFSIFLIMFFSPAYINANSINGKGYKFDDSTEIVKKPDKWIEMKDKIDQLNPNDSKFDEQIWSILESIKITDFQKRNLKNLKAQRAFLVNADFTNANLENVDLQYADIQNATLTLANLMFSHLEGAKLQNARFYAANLQHAHLDNASLQWTSFFSENLQNPTYEIQNVIYPAGPSIDTHLESVYMQHANLQHAFLKLAKLQDAKLNYSNLQHANLYNANLEDAWFTSVDFQYAILDEAVLKNTHLDNANLQHASLNNTDFEKASLYQTNLQNTNLSGAIGLTYDQLKFAIINKNTKLPEYLLKNNEELLKTARKLH